MGSARRRLTVRFDEAVWREAVRGFSGRPLEIATRARSNAERRGVALTDMLPCDAHGPGRDSARGLRQLYLPAGDAPPSERPFVLQLAQEMESTLVWVFVAFGHRHPRVGVRSVYERAHRQLHGRFPERG
jgi:hypothetical protein